MASVGRRDSSLHRDTIAPSADTDVENVFPEKNVFVSLGLFVGLLQLGDVVALAETSRS
jgi:hypothetical protein